LIPLQCEFYALEGLRGLLNTVERIRITFNPRLFLEGVILTMYDSRTLLSQQIEAEVRSHFSQTVFEALVPRNVRIAESPSHGLPVLLYDPVSKGSRAYTEVTKEFLERVAARRRAHSNTVLLEEMQAGEETTAR
jgi:chromosome partitioning protein